MVPVQEPTANNLLKEGLQLINSHIELASLRMGRQVFDPHGYWGGYTFPLLEEVSKIDEVSPYLSKHLAEIIGQLEHISNELNC